MDNKTLNFVAKPSVVEKIEREQERLQAQSPGTDVTVSVAIRSLICLGSTVVSKVAK